MIKRGRSYDNRNQPVVVIYSDAYFVIDGQTHSPGSSSIPRQWLKTKCHTYENGWGFVIHFCGCTLYSAGRVPPWLIKRFCTRKAFIYFLEVAAQFLGFLLCRQLRSSLVLSFIDNTSGFFALRKGYCKDSSICNMIALVWEDHRTLAPGVGTIRYEHQRSGVQTPIQRNGRT